MRRTAWAIGLAMMLLVVPSAAAQTPEYFPFPTGYGVSNFGVAADGAGDVWFSAQTPQLPGGQQPVAALARMRPSEAVPGTSNGITFYPTPDPTVDPSCCATQVRSIAYNAAEDRLYYVRSEGSLGWAVPGSMVPGTTQGIHSQRLAGGQDLWDVATSPLGGVWLTEHSAANVAPFSGDRVASYDGVTVTEGPNVAMQNGQAALSDQRYDAQPAGVAVAADGVPWFVEAAAGLPGYRIATYHGGPSYQEYFAAPCADGPYCSGSFNGTALSDVTVAHDGSIWFTNQLKRTFGRLDPSTLAVTQYALTAVDPSLAAGTPGQITTAPDGTLWMTSNQGYTNATANAVVRIVPSATPTASVYKTSTSSPPLGIAADNAGNVWFGTASPGPTGMVGKLAGVVGAGTGGGGDGGGGGTTPPPADPPGGGGGGGGAPAPVITSTPPPSHVLQPVTVATTRLTPPQVGNGAINTNQVCAGPPQARCSVIYLINEHEYVAGFPSSTKAKHKKKKAPRVLGTKTVTLHGGQKAKVQVKLNALGKRILKGKHKLVVTFTARQKLSGGKTKTLTRKTLTFRSH
jgi:hypothetical protein